MSDEKTNFDCYLERKLQDNDFRARFEAADRAWDIALQLNLEDSDLLPLIMELTSRSEGPGS